MKLHLVTLLIATLVISQQVFAGKLVEADADDIQLLHDAAVKVNSAYRASYIGESNGRVYFEYVTGIHSGSLFSDKPKYIVYWCRTEDISPEVLKEIIDSKDVQQVAGGDTAR